MSSGGYVEIINFINLKFNLNCIYNTKDKVATDKELHENLNNLS